MPMSPASLRRRQIEFARLQPVDKYLRIDFPLRQSQYGDIH